MNSFISQIRWHTPQFQTTRKSLSIPIQVFVDETSIDDNIFIWLWSQSQQPTHNQIDSLTSLWIVFGSLEDLLTTFNDHLLSDDGYRIYIIPFFTLITFDRREKKLDFYSDDFSPTKDREFRIFGLLLPSVVGGQLTNDPPQATKGQTRRWWTLTKR